MKKPFEEFVRTSCPLLGLNWVRFKSRRARRVIARRVAENGLRTWDEYGTLLLTDSEERVRLRGLLTVTISRFWRNSAVFGYLERVALPALLDGITPGEALVVWSAGSASGQEAFSVTAAYRGVSEADTAGHPLCVIATDLCLPALRRAFCDQWTAGELRELTPMARQRLFEPTSGETILRKDLRRWVTFVQSDLFAQPPVRFAHLILCRNTVMTYFERDAREQAMRRIVHVLRPGGYLVLGRKEKLPNSWADAWGMSHLGRRIYRREATSQ